MKKFAQSFLLASAANAILLLAGFAQPMIWVALWGAAATEILIGLFFVLVKSNRQSGAGLLLAGGISLLIGLSVCSSMTYNFH